jgi:hypothetical protein
MGGDVEMLANKAAIGKHADIVWVVEESPCMSHASNAIVVVRKNIENIIGFKSVRYGLIGFNGIGVHQKPHFHTGENLLNFCKRGLAKAVAELDFSEPEETPTDPFEAVTFAAMHYPFRPAVMKVIVLWTCNECGNQFDYYDVQTELLQRGIQLHVMTSERITVDDYVDSELFGFDASQMYTSSGVNHDLREYLMNPHDSCTVLAQETYGTVWSVADAGSSVLNVPAETIAHKLSSRHSDVSCMECECDSHCLAPRTQCYPCDVPSPVSLSGPSFFNVPYIQLQKTLSKAKKTFSSIDAWLL